MEAPEGRTRRVFTYEEARALFPAVRELTAGAVARVESLRASAPAGLSRSAAEADLRSRLEEIVDDWRREVEALGCVVKGVWLVDWDSGDGFFCWRHPEPSLAHFHGYDDGFAGRVSIQ